MRPILIVGLVALATLAGCADDGPAEAELDTDSGVDGSVDGPSGNASVSGNVSAEGNFTTGEENGTENETVMVYDNRTGRLSGTELVISGGDDAEESLVVREGTLQLSIEVTLEGDPAHVEVRGPECDDSDCAEALTVSDGRASFTATLPATGDWVVFLASDADAGPFQTDYEIVIAQEIPA